jgi:cysteine desulfurase
VIYLDYNATTPLRPEALEAMAASVDEVGNPASLHAAGQGARRRLEAALEAMAALVGATGRRVVVTGSGSEANNLAVLGIGRSAARRGRHRVLLSAVEHPCVRAACERLATEGSTVQVIPVDGRGVVDLEALERLLADDVGLVTVMLANNETGVRQPIDEIARLARSRGASVHTDAVQAAGKITVDFEALGVSSLAMAAHKLGGPKGIGALVLAPGVDPEPLWGGGGQQHGLRSGTPPVTLAAGFAAAAEKARAELAAAPVRGLLRDGLEATLERFPGAFVIAKGVPRLPNTLAIGFEGVPAIPLVLALSARGVMVGAGAACHTGEATPSAVLTAMGVPPARALSVIRVSTGFFTTAYELAAAAEALRASLGELRAAA